MNSVRFEITQSEMEYLFKGFNCLQQPGKEKKLSYIFVLDNLKSLYHLHYIISIFLSDHKIIIPCPLFYSSMVPLFRSFHEITVKSISSPMLGSGSKYENTKKQILKFCDCEVCIDRDPNCQFHSQASSKLQSIQP